MSRDSAEQLLIALEPEAASIYCRKLRLHQVIDLSQRPMTNGLDLDGSRPFDSSFRQGTGPLSSNIALFKFTLNDKHDCTKNPPGKAPIQQSRSLSCMNMGCKTSSWSGKSRWAFILWWGCGFLGEILCPSLVCVCVRVNVGSDRMLGGSIRGVC